MKKLFTAIVLAASAFTAHAQALSVATGAPSGTYSRIAKELANACGAELATQEVATTGSMQNIDKLTGNEVGAAFVQTDVIKFRGNTEDLSKIKTLVTLFPEEVHIIALTDNKLKEGGTLGFGAKQVVFNSITDLANRPVAAFGGSYVTAQVIRLQSEIPMNVVEVTDLKTALAALESGQVAAVVAVGGAKMDSITALGKQFKLLSIPEAVIGKLKNVYVPATLNYSNLSTSMGVKTVATQAIMVTREFKTPKMVDQLSKFRACFNAKVGELAETQGKHAAWSKIEVGADAKWPMMVLPNKK